MPHVFSLRGGVADTRSCLRLRVLRLQNQGSSSHVAVGGATEMPIDQKALELARECTRVKGVSFRSFERERVRRIARALIAADEENTGLREAIENAPHPDYCAGWWTSSRYDKPSWVGVRRDKCNCWKSRALAAIDGEPEVCARCKGKRKIVLCCTCGELEGEQHKPSCQR